MPVYKLIYFDARLVAELIRLLFAVASIDFEDSRLGHVDVASWKLTNPSMTLPILQIDDKMFCQRSAIARYLATEFGLMGSTNLQALRIDEVMDKCAEIWNRELLSIYGENDEDKKEELKGIFENGPMKKYLNFVEMRLMENNDDNGFLVGDKMSLGDLAIYDALQLLQNVGLDPFKDRPLLSRHSEKVATNPKVAEWLLKRPQTEV